jgi:competence protein ComEA
MNKWQEFFLAILVGMLFSAMILLISSRSVQKPIILLPTEKTILIKIHITGEIVKPGVYSLLPDSRVIDAIDTAGGFTTAASTDSINLARVMVDGEYIKIPQKDVESSSVIIDSSVTPNALPGTLKININAATIEQLDQLPGIGTIKAQEIIDYRLIHGPFLKIEEIMNVSGIGEEIFGEIKNYIVIK